MIATRGSFAVPLAVCAALALAACGGGTKTVTAPAITTTTVTDSASSRLTPPAGGSVTHRVSEANFQSPSGNIGCAIAAGTARCDIANRRWSPPSRPSSCPREVDFGQGLEVGHSGRGKFVCAGDTARDPLSQKLSYGTASEVGGFTCLSRPAGLACVNSASGHGFAISAQGYRLF